MAWRLARSLAVLRDQINQLSPNRSKVSDGTIGNAEHSARASDHNPDSSGVVRAMDITHDPAHGIDSEKLANALLASRDDRIKYVISNKKIASGYSGPQPWVWRPYGGKNPHNHHVHISVLAGKTGDTMEPWDIDFSVASGKAAKPATKPANPVLALGTKGTDVERMQKALIAHGAKLTADSTFGPKTQSALKSFQRARGLVADGVCGPSTWAELLTAA